MRKILRYFLINLGALWLTAQVIPGLVIFGGIKSLLLGGLVFMLINLFLVPLLKILLLPLNMLTLGIFAWITNVIALYALTTIVSDFKLVPFTFEGYSISGFTLPPYELSPFLVAIAASFLIGMITHLLQWLTH